MDEAVVKDLPAVICGKYRVLDEVGRGGMGRVMRVEQLSTGEVLAMKLLLGQDPESRDRFRREASALARIRGAHVVRVVDADLAPELDNAPFLVMELLEGQDLRQYQHARQRLSVPETAWVVRQIALGLSEVHAAGFVHRDLKPQNVFLDRRGGQSGVKLLDFGLVKGLDGGQHSELTRAGTMMGTPMYMSPEQVRGDASKIGPASDIWSLGMIAFELLTGKNYWTAPTVAGILVDIVTGKMPPPSSIDPTVPSAFDAWFARSCARAAEERWPSTEDQGLALLTALCRTEAEHQGVENFDRTMTMHVMPSLPSSSRLLTYRQRRQVTVLFYTISSRDPQVEALEPEDFEELERKYVRACADALGGVGDTLVRSTQGGHFVFFGYPVTYGDDARRAVEAALRLCTAAKDLSDVFQRKGAPGLDVHVGVHTGMVLVGGSRGSGDSQDLIGPVVSVATNLERLAEPGQVLVGASTWNMIAGRFQGEQVRGGGGAVRILRRLRGEQLSVSSSMIGRDSESGLLKSLLLEVLSGRARTALVTGEPGIGKSRLLQAQREEAATSGIAWIEAHCSPYFQRTAFHPFAQVISHLLNTGDGQIDHARLAEAVAQYGLAPDAITLMEVMLGLPPSDAALIGRLSPQIRKQMTMDTVVSLLRIASQRGPLCMVIEDIHWADPSTLELLTQLTSLADASLLTLLTSRPELPGGWALPEGVTSIRLQRLAPEESRKLLQQAFGGDSLPEAVLADVAQRTDGVPLFVEEMARLLSTARRASPDANASGLLAPLAKVANSLRDSLNARLDRLGHARSTVEMAAVLGNEFHLADLRGLVGGDPSSFDQLFARLADEGIVVTRGPSRQGEFAFRHALLRDAAYEAIPRDARCLAHAQAAGVLSARSEGDRVRPELLAHHLAEAGQVVPAAGLLIQAGQDALERAANAEAVGHFRRGAEILAPAMPSPEAVGLSITHHTLEGFAWIVQRGYAVPEVEAAFGRASALLQAVGDEPPPQLLPALWGRWVLTLVRGRFPEAERYSSGLLRLAERIPDPGIAMLAHLAHGTSLHGLGRTRQAREHLERAVACHDPVAHAAYRFMYGQDPLMFGKVFLAWALWMQGEPDRAATEADEAVAHAQALQHPNSLGFALAISALIRTDRGEPELTLERASALRELSEKQGWLQWTAHALLWSGAARVQQGAIADGLALIRQGRALASQAGERSGSGHYDCVLLDAEIRAGELERATTTLATLRAYVIESQEHAYEAETERLAGQLAEAHGDLDAASQQHRKALDLARHFEAPSYALRAATSLAAVERRRGVPVQDRQGRAELARLLGAFTQGLDTADLRAARQELAS